MWTFDEQQGIYPSCVLSDHSENDSVTSLSLVSDQKHFILYNQPSQSTVKIPTNLKTGKWQHLAFIYDANKKLIKHYIDGQLEQEALAAKIRKLRTGAEDNISIGRNGQWEQSLSGHLLSL